MTIKSPSLQGLSTITQTSGRIVLLDLGASGGGYDLLTNALTLLRMRCLWRLILTPESLRGLVW